MHMADYHKWKGIGMDNTIEKLQQEISKELEKKQKIEEKLKVCNERLKQLEAKKTDFENAQIVSTIREFNIKPEELGKLLASLKKDSIGTIAKGAELEEKAV